MNTIKKKIQRIKNLQQFTIEKDFSYNMFSYLVLAVFLGAGIIIKMASGPAGFTEEYVGIAVGTMAAAFILTLFPLWISVVQLIILSWLLMYAFLSVNFYPLFLLLSFGFIFSSCFELIYQWDKAVVLRMGKFRDVHGPGLFLLVPFIDRIADFVDTRIRATDFSAEKTLTSDTVPVHVDGICFWMIWDAKRAILEVQNFTEAVTLSAQTALRDSIGHHDLNTLLTERETLYKEIQSILDAKTNPWGITILSIEFTDITIPQGLEDAMSKKAQAEREKQSRIILGTAEIEISKKFAEASENYKDNETALHLRAMNMIYEGIRQKGSMILLPASALDTMNLGTVMGTTAMAKIQAGEEDAAKQNQETGNPNDKEEEKQNDNG